MNFIKDLQSAAQALQKSGEIHCGEYIPLNQIKDHLRDKEYWAVYGEGLIGAAYYNGDFFHIGMIEKGLGAKVIKQLTANRRTWAAIENNDTRTLKLVKHIGFEFVNCDNKYTYMVKQ